MTGRNAVAPQAAADAKPLAKAATEVQTDYHRARVRMALDALQTALIGWPYDKRAPLSVTEALLLGITFGSAKTHMRELVKTPGYARAGLGVLLDTLAQGDVTGNRRVTPPPAVREAAAALETALADWEAI